MKSDAQHHLLITGTGRAGTSFLVRLFDAIGFETHFSQFGEHALWDEAANAGGENLPLPADAAALPYVVKSPWAGEFIDQLLADENIVLDAVVIPLRDIDDAAASRVIVELRDVIEQNEFATKLDAPWEHRGTTPGGIVYSLHPLDQKRILALGFHHLVERLTAADVPIVFLHFPRLIRDTDYLYAKLAPVLNCKVEPEDFRAAHEKIAKRNQVRVSDVAHDPEIGRLERAALVREIDRLRGRLASAEDEEAALRQSLAVVESEKAALAKHAGLIEGSRMWRALAPARRLLGAVKRGP